MATLAGRSFIRTRYTHRETAGAVTQAVNERARWRLCQEYPPWKKRELSKIDFEMIDAFKALLQSRPDPVTADKIVDLRDKFRDAFTGWLEIDEAA